MSRLQQVRRWFVTRSIREHLLVLGFGAALLVVWLSALVERGSAFFSTTRRLDRELAAQEQMLAARPAVQARLTSELGRIEAGRTLNATQLVAELVAAAQKQGLSNSVGNPRTQEIPPFRFHTTEVLIRRAEIGPLIDLTAELVARAPYLSLEQVALRADPNNPAQIDARLVVSALQLSPP